MTSLPRSAVVYTRTVEFSESTVPTALLRRHTTKPGVWGRIRVVAGSLRYRILAPTVTDHILSPERPGVIEPEVPHEVLPLGPVRFYVEFLREDGTGSLPGAR